MEATVRAGHLRRVALAPRAPVWSRLKVRVWLAPKSSSTVFSPALDPLGQSPVELRDSNTCSAPHADVDTPCAFAAVSASGSGRDPARDDPPDDHAPHPLLKSKLQDVGRHRRTCRWPGPDAIVSLVGYTTPQVSIRACSRLARHPGRGPPVRHTRHADARRDLGDAAAGDVRWGSPQASAPSRGGARSRSRKSGPDVLLTRWTIHIRLGRSCGGREVAAELGVADRPRLRIHKMTLVPIVGVTARVLELHPDAVWRRPCGLDGSRR